MNVVFMSPHFPQFFWMFCDRLKKNGANVLGIADCPYDNLDQKVKDSLTEYYYVQSMEDYDQVYRAVAYFSFKYGKIDWLESNNEYWLEQDARLRTDFHITTGEQYENIGRIKHKSAMKKYYAEAGVPTARIHKVTDWNAAKEFLGLVGYPVVVKPDAGIGACDTYKLNNDDDLANFFNNHPPVPYVMEEFIDGDIVSYEAILDNESNPLVESCTFWPSSIMNIVTDQLDLAYQVPAYVPENLRDAGRRTVRAFGVKSRFVHLEFFKLRHDKPGLGNAGDIVGLEVNMRPPGGVTPDMMNFAHSADFFQMWADMVTTNSRVQPDSNNHRFCAYAGRRDQFEYVHSDDEIWQVYRSRIMKHERVPELMVPQLGNRFFVAVFDTEEEAKAYMQFVTERR